MFDSGDVNDAPRPVMTFRIAGEWLAVPVEQMDRIAVSEQLWPVPLSLPQYMGVMEDGPEMIPVLCLDLGGDRLPLASPLAGEPTGSSRAAAKEQLIAILHVRGESVGLAIDGAGRVYDGYRVPGAGAEPPAGLRAGCAALAQCPDGDFWLIDPDRLWQAETSTVTDILSSDV